MTHMEREWQVGRTLSVLENQSKGVPGFMSTGSAVVTKSGVFRGKAVASYCMGADFYSTNNISLDSRVLPVYQLHGTCTQPALTQ